MASEVFTPDKSNYTESHERDTGLHFLIVEDKPENYQAAQRYLNQQSDTDSRISADFAVDYDSAIENIVTGKYNAIITDLFFPKKIGSNDVSLGQKIVSEIEQMRQHPDFFAKLSADDNSSILSYFDHDLINLKSAVSMQEFSIASDSYMNQDMSTDESNQPLGGLVAEEAKNRQIPYLIVTSGHGHRDISTPVGVYLKEKGILAHGWGWDQRSWAPRSDLVRDGEVLSFDDYCAQKMDSDIDFRSLPIEKKRSQYEFHVTSLQRIVGQPYILDAKKHEEHTWGRFINLMQYAVKQGEDKNTPSK